MCILKELSAIYSAFTLQPDVKLHLFIKGKAKQILSSQRSEVNSLVNQLSLIFQISFFTPSTQTFLQLDCGCAQALRHISLSLSLFVPAPPSLLPLFESSLPPSHLSVSSYSSLSLALFLLFHMASRPFLSHLRPSSVLWCQHLYCHTGHYKDKDLCSPFILICFYLTLYIYSLFF